MNNESPRFTQLPEAMEVADVGPYIKSLREHYRLSVNDVAHRLHIRPRYIEAIEASDFDFMPSKVYARGYVASYAEFLGIDPDQVAARCFGAAPVKKDDFFMPTVAKKTISVKPLQWRPFAVALAVVGALWLAYQASDRSVVDVPEPQEYVKEEPSVALGSVSEVPEDMLAHTRQLIMPTGALYRCLIKKKTLACTAAWQSPSPPKRSLVDTKIIPAMWVQG
jgi:cytoskeletal protein RodZ